MIYLSTHYIIKTQEIQEIWNMRGWATQIDIQCDLICSGVVSEMLVTQITWNDSIFKERRVLRYDVSGISESRPAANSSFGFIWLIGLLLCYVMFEYILGPPISDQLLEYYHRLTFHGNKEWERSRKTRLAKLQKEMEKLQTTITHDEDYIARLGGMNFPYATYIYLPSILLLY